MQILFFLDIYPDALHDFLVNQNFITIESHPISLKLQYSDTGKLVMQGSSVIIIGTGRNVGKHLKSFLGQVDSLCKDFNQSQVIFVIEKSTDDSLKILEKWSSESTYNRRIVSIDSMNEVEHVGVFENTLLPREGRIALARNLALSEARKQPKADYIINIDMDIIGWNMNGVRDSFGRNDKWDIVCSNGVIVYGVYRDIYAFRAPSISTNHHLCGNDHKLYNISNEQKKLNRKHHEVALCVNIYLIQFAINFYPVQL